MQNVNLHNGPANGTVLAVDPPWPRSWVTTEDGDVYWVTEGTTDAYWADPALMDTFDPTPSVPGIAGPIGPPGPVGATGPAGPGMTWRNTWNAAVNYVVNDAVNYLGQSYVAIAINTNVNPSTDIDANGHGTKWDLLAKKGADGAVGPQGPQGVQGPAGTSGHVILDEGVPVPPRSKMDFVGSSVALTDDAANDKTIITVGGVGGGSSTYEKIVAEHSFGNYWPVDEAAGAGTVVDGESAKNLTPTAGVTLGSSGPPVGGTAALFNGTADLAGAHTMVGVNDFALGAWVFVPSGGMYGFVIHVGASPNGYGIGIGAAASGQPLGPTLGLRVFGFYTGIRAINSAYDVTADTWHHVLLARRANVTEIWVDGRRRFNDSGTAPNAPGVGVHVGNDGTSPVDPNRRVSNGVKIAKAFYVSGRAIVDFELSRLARWRP